MNSRSDAVVLSLLLWFGSATLACATGAEHPGVDTSNEWPSETDYERFSKDLMSALERADPIAMSLLVNFPLSVHLADRTSIVINDEYTLQKRFDQIFPKAFRDHVLAVSKAGTGEDGWVGDKGYMFANGSLWANRFGESVGTRFRIYVVNTVIPGQQEAAQPTLFACETIKHRIVVDTGGAEGTLRYRAWNKPHFPPEKPDLTLLKGESHSSGTGGCFARSWLFKTGPTSVEVQQVRCTAGEDAPPNDTRAVVNVDVNGKASQSLYCF